MARTALAVQAMTRAGLTPAYTAANGSGGHSVVNDGRTFLHVKNGGASPCVVTFETPGTVDTLAIADRTVTVAAGGEAVAGTFPTQTYGASMLVDFDQVTSVTVAAIKTPTS